MCVGNGYWKGLPGFLRVGLTGGFPRAAFLAVVIFAWTFAAFGGGIFDPSSIFDTSQIHDLDEACITAQQATVARATALIALRSDLRACRSDSSRLKLAATTFRESANLCSGEPFAEQPTAGFCSGFLVGTDLLLTAGHCIKDMLDCAHAAIIFDYAYDHSGREPTLVAKSEVYDCHDLIAQKIDPESGIDFSLIRLERPVRDRAPLLLRREGEIGAGANVGMAGNPSGLPTKIATGARVNNTNDGNFFIANVDSFGGNSGAPVFDEANGRVEGMIVRGDEDFESQNDCHIIKRCTASDCQGEEILRATLLAPYVPEP